MAEYTYINSTGVIIADTGEVKTLVENEYKSTFGQDLNVDPSTPQGVLITAETLARSEMLRNNAALANQINPNLAGGVFLDAILALTGSQRVAAEPSFATCVLNGVASTVIPEGAQASSSTGIVFQSTSTVTLDGSGQATVIFSAVVPGAVSVPANFITQVVSDILGWETVNNPAQGTIGSDEQTDEQARELRRVTLAAQGTALPEAIISDLYLVPGVKSLVFRENYTDSPIVIDGKTLIPHSIYVIVDGGTDTDVATSLLNKKSMGCAYNGSTNVTLTVPISGQSYIVKFDRPDVISVLVKATVKANSSIQDPTTAVKQAILDYANGLLPGEPGFVVGASVSPFELAGAVNIEVPGLYVKKMEVSFASVTSWTTDELPILIYQIANITIDSIIVDVVS